MTIGGFRGSCYWSFYLTDKDLLIRRARLCSFSTSLLLTSIQRQVFGKLHHLLSKKWSSGSWRVNSFPSYSIQAALRHPSVGTEFEKETEMNRHHAAFLWSPLSCSFVTMNMSDQERQQTSKLLVPPQEVWKESFVGLSVSRARHLHVFPCVFRDSLWVSWFPPPSKHVPYVSSPVSALEQGTS